MTTDDILDLVRFGVDSYATILNKVDRMTSAGIPYNEAIEELKHHYAEVKREEINHNIVEGVE